MVKHVIHILLPGAKSQLMFLFPLHFEHFLNWLADSVVLSGASDPVMIVQMSLRSSVLRTAEFSHAASWHIISFSVCLSIPGVVFSLILMVLTGAALKLLRTTHKISCFLMALIFIVEIPSSCLFMEFNFLIKNM